MREKRARPAHGQILASPEMANLARGERRYVLLDRDGTLIVERHYLGDPGQVELLPGTIEGLRRLSRLGLGLAVVTNQSGIGRGYFDADQVAAVHRRLCILLAAGNVFLDGIFVCPHTPEDDCACRKPGTGLIEQASAQLGCRPCEAFVVGDKPCDVELGRRVGATTILVRTGYGAETEGSHPRAADYVADDVRGAAGIIAGLVTACSISSAGEGVAVARPGREGA